MKTLFPSSIAVLRAIQPPRGAAVKRRAVRIPETARIPVTFRSMELRVGGLLAVAAVCLWTGTALASGTRTHAQIYTPFTASGKPAFPVADTVSGYCLGGSVGVEHAGA
jgi:hypothetical protein